MSAGIGRLSADLRGKLSALISVKADCEAGLTLLNGDARTKLSGLIGISGSAVADVQAAIGGIIKGGVAGGGQSPTSHLSTVLRGAR